MFAKLFKRPAAQADNKINGCEVVKASDKTADFPFCSDIIYLNEQNQMGVEFNWDVRIRIDGVLTTDDDSFIQMMDALVEIARRFEYKQLFFADSLSEEVLDMFLNYGFGETKVLGDPYNHYLDFYLEEKEKMSIWKERVE